MSHSTAIPVKAQTRRRSLPRTAALAITTLLTVAAPTSWGLSALVQLLDGAESDHRFHQLTGQGLLLCGLWLAGLVPVLVAGWRGRAPSGSAALGYGAVVASCVATAALAPGYGGGGATAVVVVFTAAMLWWALPVRTQLRAVRPAALDPVAAPVAFLTMAVLTPYAVSQAALQRTVHDEHAELAHYFDMAWVSLTIVLLVLAAALVPAGRRLLVIAMAGLAVLSGAGVALNGRPAWSLLGLLLAAAGLTGSALASREK